MYQLLGGVCLRREGVQMKRFVWQKRTLEVPRLVKLVWREGLSGKQPLVWERSCEDVCLAERKEGPVQK